LPETKRHSPLEPTVVSPAQNIPFCAFGATAVDNIVETHLFIPCLINGTLSRSFRIAKMQTTLKMAIPWRKCPA
jgi:hypothetical protein